MSSTSFTKDTQRLHGRNAELLDAFAFGKVNIEDTTASFRVGRYALQWGESLFFGSNGVAAAMAPIDIVKAQSVPNTQFKELVRPVEQVSGQWQISRICRSGPIISSGGRKTALPGPAAIFPRRTISGRARNG